MAEPSDIPLAQVKKRGRFRFDLIWLIPLIAALIGGWLAVRAVLAWDALAKRSPGRLRPCANDECRLFLIDRSKANAARWCSMAVCGNRMKARRHYQRSRNAQAE